MVKLRYQHQSTSLQTRRAWEDIAADSAFQLGLLMPLDTASFLLPFGYGITCLLLSSCFLSSRCSSPDWQASHWRGGQIRPILFLSALLHVFICFVIGVQPLFSSLHAHLPCMTLRTRGSVHYGKKKKEKKGVRGSSGKSTITQPGPPSSEKLVVPLHYGTICMCIIL